MGPRFCGVWRIGSICTKAESPENQAPLGAAEESSRQIEKAVQFILQRDGQQKLSIISHSWGSMPTGLFAGRYPQFVERIVFFAPIAHRPGENLPVRMPAWRLVSLEEQRKRFVADVPENEHQVLSRRHFGEWGPLYLDTDMESRTRSPESVKIPNGPTRDIAEAFAGRLAYDPAAILAPMAIIRGEWDSVVTDEDARWMFESLKNVRIKRDVKISRATHLMHLETSRFALYRETRTFLDGCDEPPLHRPSRKRHA